MPGGKGKASRPKAGMGLDLCIVGRSGKGCALACHRMETCETGPVTGPNTPAKGPARVFVASKTKSPLMPYHPARARGFLAKPNP